MALNGSGQAMHHCTNGETCHATASVTEIVTVLPGDCSLLIAESETQWREELNMASALVQRQVKHEARGCVSDLSDGCLLERYLTADEVVAQEAFKVLVERHGPMVLGICRHILNEQHDAEDAFQATFLVLAQKGGSIRNRTVLAGWLHEVAHRIAIKVRVSGLRRRSLERQAMAMLPEPTQLNPQDEAAAWNELRPVLHDEVDKLPEKYRLPVILCYLEGKTNEEVAEMLHWPVGTVKGRLSRARDLLRSRLVRRGLSLSAAFLLTTLSQGRVFAEVVPAELVKTTVQLARKFGPRREGLSVYRGEPEQAPVEEPPAQAAQHSRPAPRLRVRWKTVAWLTLLGLVLSTSVGVSLAAVSSGGGFGGLGSALRSMIPARAVGGSGMSCH
jgi:RNA polymerase sigma factor (sigma-70 family)